MLNSRRRQFIASALARIQHIFNENAVATCRIVDKHVVTAPTSLPFRMIGLPDSSVVNKGQQNLRKNVFEMLHFFFARHGKYLCFLADSCVFMLAHSVIRKQLDLFGNTARGKVFFYPL